MEQHHNFNFLNKETFDIEASFKIKDLDSCMIILNTVTGDFMEVNKLGREILIHIKEGLHYEAIKNALSKKYSGFNESELKSFISQLVVKKIIKRYV